MSVGAEDPFHDSTPKGRLSVRSAIRCIVRLVAAGALCLAATASPAWGQSDGYTLSLAGPSTATVGQPIVLQATGSNPPDDFFSSWLDVHAVPASVLATCPAGYLNASQVAGSTWAQGGEGIAIAQRENVDPAGNFSMPLAFSPRVPGQFLVCAYTNDGATWTHTSASLTLTVQAPSTPGGGGGGTLPPPTGGSVPSTPVVTVALSRAYKLVRRATRFSALKLTGVPSGSKVVATCRYKGRTCAGKAGKTFTKRRASGTVSLKRFRKVTLKPGSVITIKVTKPGAVGAVEIIRIRKNQPPRVTTRCLQPGSSTVVSC